MLHIPGLYIAESPERGRGVYTAEELNPGDLIEICPVIKIPEIQLKLIDQTILYDYYFLWEEDGYKGCIAMGYGSLYNHHKQANAIFIFDYTDDTIKIECSGLIKEGEEILIDYTGEGLRSEQDLWFDPS
jgi:SET domain-containing protein